jgi:ABC-type Zn2+ transport system substrate-binding protein/surface adhesin
VKRGEDRHDEHDQQEQHEEREEREQDDHHNQQQDINIPDGGGEDEVCLSLLPETAKPCRAHYEHRLTRTSRRRSPQ